MKKLVLLVCAAMLSAGLYANNPAVSEKVLKAFRETFSSAENVSWHEVDRQYSVHFFQSDVRYIVYYNKAGKITASMRFYTPALLPMTILSELNKSHSDKKAFGVTEITSGGSTAYFIKMQDDNNWYTLKADAYGSMELVEVMQKQK